ncbi:MAG: Mov34/MPN/PAD-1 family protein, partial [Candidatus Thorarchaeota archaeon]
LVAIFHSHTAPPHPSEKDLDNMRLNQVVWLIASRYSGTWKTRAFLLVDNQLEEIALEVL